jgi:hypothetical protein
LLPVKIIQNSWRNIEQTWKENHSAFETENPQARLNFNEALDQCVPLPPQTKQVNLQPNQQPNEV